VLYVFFVLSIWLPIKSGADVAAVFLGVYCRDHPYFYSDHLPYSIPTIILSCQQYWDFPISHRGLLPRPPLLLPRPPPPHPDSARRLGLLQGCFFMEDLEISMIRVRAALLQSGCSPAAARPGPKSPSIQVTVNPSRRQSKSPSIQVAVNPSRPIDLKPARRHDDRGALD